MQQPHLSQPQTTEPRRAQTQDAEARGGDIEFTLNGETSKMTSGTTVAGLVASLGIVRGKVAVERNLQVVPRSQWNATELAEGDNLEIVHFVGGG